MADFHALRVKKIKKEAGDSVSVSLDIPPQLRSIFSYKQGQYLTFKKTIDGVEERRSYSLCSSPVVDEDWQVAIKKVEGGKFSTYANEELKEGDVMAVMPPEGNFFSEIRDGQKKKYIALAAGSGITPVISIIKTALYVEGESEFKLYYGNRDSSSVIFKRELDELEEKYGSRFKVVYIMSRDDRGEFRGRITPDLCEDFSKSDKEFFSADEYFLCGPEEMIFSVRDILTSKEIDKDKIHFELFTTPVKDEEATPAALNDVDIDSEVTIILDGEEYNFNLSTSGESVLDTAMEAGADVPFSCKGAVCCTCRARLVEGNVWMQMNYALTDKEVEDGYILTCQSHPITPRLIIDYDAD